MVDYPYIRRSYDMALREAFNNGKNSAEFLEFKAAREADYEESAIYRVLSKIHGNDDRAVWENRDSYTDEEIAKISGAGWFGNWDKVDKDLFVNRL